MKIAIIIPYFKRPNLVRNALQSILYANENYQDWELLFHDDGSPEPGEEVVRDVLKGHLDKVKFARIEYESVEAKRATGGIMGAGLNKMMKETDADVAFILCDDDAIYPDYLLNLATYFKNNPERMMCYSHVQLWEPTKERLCEALKKPHADNHFNQWTEPIISYSKNDWSQVAWRLQEVMRDGIWFPSPCEKNHDAAFFDLLNKAYGLTHFSGCTGQLKAWWPGQQSWIEWPNSIKSEVKIDGPSLN